MKFFPIILLAFFFCSTSLVAQTPAKSADKIMKAAYKQAKKEKKNVFVMFHASWCHWCHKMDEAMNDPTCKKFFDDNYIIVHLVKGEYADEKKALNTPGGNEFCNANGGENQGLPYWFIVDKKGKLLENAHAKADKPSNLGCPAADDEVEIFTQKLKNTSKLKTKELAIIATRFKKNNPSNR